MLFTCHTIVSCINPAFLTPLARLVGTSIDKVVLSIPLRDLYLHDGRFESVISASFATEHGIDLRREDGVFQDNLLLDHTME